ncbi:MAG: S1C family serine protease [Planctomycetota bacterium]
MSGIMSANLNRDSVSGEQSPTTNNWLVAILTALVGVLLVRSLLDSYRNRPDYTSRVVVPRGELGADERATISVFENVADSVVFIRVVGVSNRGDEELASGTGFVWDEAGHIITNGHVVESALNGGQIEVQFSDSQTYVADLLGIVSRSDVAVLRVDAPPAQLSPIPIGTSEDLKVGQTVLAIGNPFGFDRTLSTGVIGGLNRVVVADQREVLGGLIQTDAAINPGNSGGPLLDSAGRLIGVNTAIVSTSGASAGLGFAVPISDVRESIDLVMAELAMPPMPRMGIAILDAETARAHRVPDEILTGGLVVLSVYPNTPADAAGLEGCRQSGSTMFLGDQITAINEQQVSTFEDLARILRTLSAGDTVIVDVVRGGRRLKVPMTLEAAEKEVVLL